MLQKIDRKENFCESMGLKPRLPKPAKPSW
jgi:hypothetical protein